MNLLPYPNQPKEENLKYGFSLIEKMYKFNNIEKVKQIKISNRINTHGAYYYYKEKILINLKKCQKPVNKPGFKWSYTGNTADLTPAGVLAHEFGHYLDDINGFIGKSCLFRDVINSEKKMNSYCVSQSENFAEMIKLFITNPDFLKRAFPKRYNYCITILELKPIISENLEYILQFANIKLLNSALNKCKK